MNVNIKNILGTIALSSMLMASCSQQELETPKDNIKGTPIKVSVAAVDTRAGYDTPEGGEALLPESFYLTIDQTGTEYDYSRVLMTKNEDNTYSSQSTLLWAGSEDVHVVASTFYHADAGTLCIAENQAEEFLASDHLFVSTIVKPSTSGIELNFDHIMAKVVLNVALGEGNEAAENPITSVNVKGASHERAYTYADGLFTWGDIADEANYGYVTPLLVDYTASTATYEVVLVPQVVEAGAFTIDLTYGDNAFTWRYDKALTLESGHRYQINLQIDNSEAE